MSTFGELITGEKPVLVDFFATWCGPCKTMHPILEQLKSKMGERIRIVKVDIDKPANKNIIAQHNVRSVPTLVIFKGGKSVWRGNGVHSAEQVEQIIEGL